MDDARLGHAVSLLQTRCSNNDQIAPRQSNISVITCSLFSELDPCEGGFSWPSIIVLVNFTEQGFRNIKDTIKRGDAIRDMAKKFGVTAKEYYWTLGSYDVIDIFDAPDDASMAAFRQPSVPWVTLARRPCGLFLKTR